MVKNMNYEFIKYDIEDLKPEEVVEYLRKSQSDDPTLTVDEVLERHEGILNEWAEKNIGGRVPEKNVYREVESGETIAGRPEVQKMLRKIESPRIRAISCVEPQRLSRGDLEDIGRIMKLIKHTNTLVITPNKIYNLHDKYDWDAFERELKQGNDFLEYTKMILNRGRLRSVSEGNFIGSVAPYGFDKTFVKCGKKKCPTLKENKEQADVVRMIFDMYVNQDLGRYNICHKLDEMGIKPPKGDKWSANSLPDMLENVHYIGKVTWNWRKTQTIVEDSEIKKTRPKAKIGEFLIYDGKHDGIISEELFNAAQEKKGRHHRAKPNTKIRNPLAGLLYCSCGRAMSMRIYKKKDGSMRSPARLLCDGQVYCNSGSVYFDEMIAKVKDVLQQSITDFEVRLSNNEGDSIKMHKKMIDRLEKRMKELNEDEVKIWDERSRNRGTEDEMPDYVFKQLKDNIQKEKNEVQQALQNAYESMPNPVDYEEKLATFKDALEALNDPEVEAIKKNNLLKACIDKMIYTRSKPVRLTKKNCAAYGIKPDELTTGGNWYTPPFELDVNLKI